MKNHLFDVRERKVYEFFKPPTLMTFLILPLKTLAQKSGLLFVAAMFLVVDQK